MRKLKELKGVSPGEGCFSSMVVCLNYIKQLKGVSPREGAHERVQKVAACAQKKGETLLEMYNANMIAGRECGKAGEEAEEEQD